LLYNRLFHRAIVESLEEGYEECEDEVWLEQIIRIEDRDHWPTSPHSTQKKYHPISHHPNTKPPQPAQHPRPSTGHQQQEAPTNGERQHNPWSRSAKRWR